jgi:hypothetical protein
MKADSAVLRTDSRAMKSIAFLRLVYKGMKRGLVEMRRALAPRAKKNRDTSTAGQTACSLDSVF